MSVKIKRHKKKYTRINSADPDHKAVTASQWAARKKRVRSGELRTKYTFTKGARKGQTVHYDKPVAYTETGLPVYSQGNKVPVKLKNGTIGMIEKRVAAREMGKTLILQEI